MDQANGNKWYKGIERITDLRKMCILSENKQKPNKDICEIKILAAGKWKAEMKVYQRRLRLRILRFPALCVEGTGKQMWTHWRALFIPFSSASFCYASYLCYLLGSMNSIKAQNYYVRGERCYMIVPWSYHKHMKMLMFTGLLHCLGTQLKCGYISKT